MQQKEIPEAGHTGTYTGVSNFTLVVAILPREIPVDTIKQAIPPGEHRHVFINARGTLYKDKWYQKLKPAVSPEQIIVEVLLPDELAGDLMDHLCEVGNLNNSGSGIIYTSACRKVLFFSEQPGHPATMHLCNRSGHQPKNNAQIIFCIIQNNRAEDVAIAAIRAGAHGPTVTYGQGRGIREKLGLLRIAISPEKAFIRVVVNDYNAESVFEAMIREGKLDTPGMGFISLMPLNDALVNVASVALGKDELAHQYQIIKAIDELKGGSNWRTFGVAAGNAGRKCLLHLSRLSCVISRGQSQPLIQAAMDAGASGASISFGVEGVSEKNLNSGIQIKKEVEIIEITISDDRVEELLATIISTIKENRISCYIYVQEVIKAFTYMG